MKKVTLAEARIIGKYLRDNFSYYSGQIKIKDDGAVTIFASPMPNTNVDGWVFAGWDTELLQVAATREIKINPDINDAQHPSRQKAIKVLEAIAEKLGNSWIFDNASQNRKDEPDGTWYDYEDMVTNIIEGEKNE